jgi:L-iditol 2-dehydrogenase
MKALIKDKNAFGIQTVPLPKLDTQNNVLIRVMVSGLCRTDVYVAEGLVKSAKERLILGHEFSGVVTEIGAGAGDLNIGDRVAVMPVFPIDTLNSPEHDGAINTMLGIDHDGSFSEFIAVPSSFVYKMPQTMSFKQGAYLEPVAASLAPLKANISPEQTGLIYGENRISRLTERVLKAKGFNNISVFDEADYAAQSLPENHYDFIIETFATTTTIRRLIKAVKPNGTIILKSRQHNPVEVNINSLVMKDITLQAVNYGDFQEGIDLIASGALQIDDLLGAVYDLDEYEQVFALSKQGEEKKIFLSAVNQNVWDS